MSQTDIPFRQAVAAHQAGQLGDAERLYQRVLEEDAGHADATHLLGLLAHQTGDSARAAELITTAVERNPGNWAYHNNLGNALTALGRWEDAVVAFGRSLRLEPESAATLANLSTAHKARGCLSQAEECEAGPSVVEGP